MRKLMGWACGLGLLLGVTSATVVAAPPAGQAQAAGNWEQCGWGGGGFYWSAVFDPTNDGVIYMGGDVLGVYKTEDHGRNWRFVNNGLVNYGVYSLAVDRMNSKTVYAGTEGGLCKSTDGGAHWELLPLTGPKDLRITSERGKSVRAIAVDPTDSKVVYAASPKGKVYKSADGGQTWKAVYEKGQSEEDPTAARVQFGKASGAWFGGIWIPFEFPKGVKTEDCVGFGVAFKGDGTNPDKAFMTLQTTGGATYGSKNLGELFKDTTWRNVVLNAADFTLDPDYAKKNPEKAKALPATIDWSTVSRMDLTVVGPLPTDAYVAKIDKLFFALTRSADGQTGTAEKPIIATVREFSKDKAIQSYGNIRLGSPAAGTIYSVTVAQKDPSLVLAATQDSGLVLSADAGQTWTELKTPKKASSAAVAPSDANIIYGAFGKDGIWKSTDKGQNWTDMSKGLPKDASVLEVVVSPANPLDVYAIGGAGWSGTFCFSHDGGQTWKASASMAVDAESGDPTLPSDAAKSAGLSSVTNLAINPQNPKELFISANWRSCLSSDGGLTWTERMKGADISVVYDVRFSGSRTYAAAMDEGSLVSDNNGQSWRQLWPLKFDPALSGHNWRMAISNENGADHIICSVSPWGDKIPSLVVVSEDGGKTHKVVTAGLPNYVIQPNTMWGSGYPRSMAADPKNPKVVYMGIDGDAADGKSGGGIFKTEDGGYNWKQLAHQPACRRMFFGLAVDPTDSKRLFWGCCGPNGGVYRSEDGGETWQHVFSTETWAFNVLVAADGTVYCPGKNLWRSADHGATWKQVTQFTGNRSIIGLETDPRDAKTMWISATTWDGSSDGAVYKTSDGCATWQEITGNLPYRKPLVLRFNPATNELWAAGSGLFKIKQ